MRESSGRSSRLSTKLKAAVITLLAILTVGAIGATSASAAQSLDLNFTDGWIRVPALDSINGPGGGTFHAVDPSSENAPTIGLTGSLGKDGNFSSKASDFSFPTQNIDAGPGFGTISLEITAASDITGTYNQGNGAFDAKLPLTLTVRAPSLPLNCQVSPLNIPLGTSGSEDFLTDNDGPGPLSGTPFVGGGGNVLGSWTATIDNVKGIDGTSDEQCKAIIQGLIGQGNTNFDGSLWMSGTAAVTGEPDPDVCPVGQVGIPPNCVIPPPPVCDKGQVGTPPNCSTPAKPAKITRLKVKPKKLVIKRKKKRVLKVRVTNGGGKAAKRVKVCAKAPGKLVKKVRCAKIRKIAPGKTATAKFKFKAKRKKGQGKIKIVVKPKNAHNKRTKVKLKVK